MANIDFSKLVTSEQKTLAAREAVLAQLADLRWQRETGGIVFAKGQMMSTSRESQMQVANLHQSLEAGLLDLPVLWKFDAGWVALSSDQVKQMAKAVNAHVRQCFAAEKEVFDRVQAAKSPYEIDLAMAFELAYQAAE